MVNEAKPHELGDATIEVNMDLNLGSFFAAVVFGFGAGLGWALIMGIIAMLKRN